MDNKTIRHFGKNTLNEFLEELKERVIDKIHNIETIMPKKLSDLENDLDIVKTVNGTEPDENGNIEVDSVKSWEDLEGKPFYEKESFAYLVEATEYQGSIIRWNKAIEEGKTYILTVGDKEYEGVAFYKGNPYYCTCIDFVGIGLGLLFEGIVLPNEYNGEIVSLKTKTTTIKTLDEKFLPKALQFGEKELKTHAIEPTTITFNGRAERDEDTGEQLDIVGSYESVKLRDAYDVDEWLDVSTVFVMWNGVEYEVTAYKNKQKLGDIGDDIGLLIFPDEMGHGYFEVQPYVIDNTVWELNAEISIYTKATEIKQLDAKFIPANCDMIIEVPSSGSNDLVIGNNGLTVTDINNVIELVKQGKSVSVVIKAYHAYGDNTYTHQIKPTHILLNDNSIEGDLLHIHWLCTSSSYDLGTLAAYKLVWNGSEVVSVDSTSISTVSGAS